MFRLVHYTFHLKVKFFFKYRNCIVKSTFKLGWPVTLARTVFLWNKKTLFSEKSKILYRTPWKRRTRSRSRDKKRKNAWCKLFLCVIHIKTECSNVPNLAESYASECLLFVMLYNSTAFQDPSVVLCLENFCSSDSGIVSQTQNLGP